MRIEHVMRVDAHQKQDQRVKKHENFHFSMICLQMVHMLGNIIHVLKQLR